VPSDQRVPLYSAPWQKRKCGVNNKYPVDSREAVRGFTIVEIIIVVTIIAMLAAFAIPALRRVNNRAQDTAVSNNGRQISAALDLYFLDYGTNTALLADLMGNVKYLKNFRPIAAEVYPTVFTQGQPFTVTGIGGNRSITFSP
jgi:prepilin-type N-terminal cleavage/methylation domain-containing protein